MKVGLEKVLAEHAKWVRGDGGERADLSGADLHGADLRGVSFRGAYLHGTNFRGADLHDADFRGAFLLGASFFGANLHGADLRGVDLRGASLFGAVLIEANLRNAGLPHFQICPQVGSFSAFKKLCGGEVIEVEIPAEAKRTSSLVGRKCRAEYVKVITKGVDGVAGRDQKTRYTSGQLTRADKYDDDIRVECTHGIHFFMTREEAQQW